MEDEDFLIAEIFKTLSNPLRIQILKKLEKENICQCNLAEVLKENPVNISRALDLLEELEIIEREKRGNKIFPKVKIKKIFKLLKGAEDISKEIAKLRMKKYSKILGG